MNNKEGLVHLVLNRAWLTISKLFGNTVNKDTRLKDDGHLASRDPFPMITSPVLTYDRLSRYRDYEDMDANSAYISTALDIYSSDCTQFDSFMNATVWIKSENREFSKILNKFLQEVAEIEDVVTSECRSIAKYGSMKNFYVIEEGKGIVKIRPIIDDIFVLRIEDSHGRLLGYRRDPTSAATMMPPSIPYGHSSNQGLDFKFYEVGHARLRERPYIKTISNNQQGGVMSDFATEGYAMIEPARRPVRDYELLKEAVMVYRVTHSIDRLEHKIDLTGKAPDEGLDYMNRYMNALKRREYIDKNTNRVSLMPNLPSFLEDLFTPTWQNNLTTSALLKTTGDVSSIEDLKILQEEIEGSLKFPPGFLFRSDSASIQFNKPISSENIILARHIDKLQRAYKQYIYKTCMLHLVLLGKKIDTNSFEVMMSPISYSIDLQKTEVLSQLINNASALLPLSETLGIDKVLWNKYVFRLTLGKIDFGEVVDSISNAQAQQGANLVLKVKEHVLDNDKKFLKQFPNDARQVLESYKSFMDSKEFDDFSEQINKFVENYVQNPTNSSFSKFNRVLNKDTYEFVDKLKRSNLPSLKINNAHIYEEFCLNLPQYNNL